MHRFQINFKRFNFIRCPDCFIWNPGVANINCPKCKQKSLVSEISDDGNLGVLKKWYGKINCTNCGFSHELSSGI